MTSEGVMAAFAETSSSALKVGLLGLAIIRRMTRYINSGQSGFSVTSSFDAESAEPLQKRYSLDPMFSASLSTPVVDQELPEGFYV